MRNSNVLICLSIVAALSWSCSNSTEPPKPTSISLSTSQVELDAIGATEQLTAQVLDQNGQPMPQEPVTWSSADEAVATVSSSGRVTAVANGTATITARSGSASGSATITVRQIVVTIEEVAGDAQTGTVGQPLPIAITVETRDRLGVPVPGASVGFNVVLGGGSVSPASASTGSNGRATTVWTLGTTAGSDQQLNATHSGAPSVSFTATATAGAASSLEKVQGDGQTGAAATALSDSIVVRVLDGHGNPVPGLSASFTVTGGGGAASPASVNTDLAGRAATEWTLGPQLGDNTLEVSVAALPPVTFNATSELGPPTLISIQAGDGQSATVGTAVAIQPTVEVTDAGGNLVAGATVTFGVIDGDGSVTGAEATTDAAGLAAVGSWTLGTVAGTNTLRATLDNGTFVNLIATGTAGPATNLMKVAGDGQTSTAGLPVPELPTVSVTDQYGNGVPDVSVVFAVASGGGSVSGANPTTGPDGHAAVGSWTLGPNPGTNELTASVTDLPTVTFTATGVAGASSIEKAAGDDQSATVGTAVTVPPTVRLTDALGNPVAGQQVTFLVQTGGGSVTDDVVTSDAAGLAAVGSWTLGTTAGTNLLTAETEALAPVTFTATGTVASPTSIAVNEGNGQTGLIAFAVNIPPSVRISDTYGNPVDGVSVNFSVTGGGGSVSGATAVSDASGIAAVAAWTLGASPALNTLDATAPGIGSVGFNATGVAGAFDIEVRFLTSVSQSQEQTFLDAAARWEQLLYGELSDVPLNIPAGSCGSNALPAVNETIDDLLIFASIEFIDGPGKILGQATPCYIRSSNRLPLLGRMQFDSADVANLEASGHFDEVIVHEMGHVLGFGALIWSDLGLLADPSLQGGSDPHFTGERAIEAFDRIGGTSYTGSKVPVENIGGPGTADSHWRESVFGNELMTGYINSGANPLSVVTVASFWDMAYTVNLDGADPFSLSFPLQAFGAPVALRLVDDIARGPIYAVDAAGRVIGVIRER